MSKVALVVVDVQKAFHESPMLKNSVDFSLYAIHGALGVFRETNNPVFFVQDDGVSAPAGSPGFELSSALTRNENEYQIIKRHQNSFFETDLREKLMKEKVGFVVVCGLSAQFCVNATIQGATENGFKAALLHHGVAGMTPDHVRVAQETNSIISVDALRYFLTT